MSLCIPGQVNCREKKSIGNQKFKSMINDERGWLTRSISAYQTITNATIQVPLHSMANNERSTRIIKKAGKYKWTFTIHEAPSIFSRDVYRSTIRPLGDSRTSIYQSRYWLLLISASIKVICVMIAINGRICYISYSIWCLYRGGGVQIFTHATVH